MLIHHEPGKKYGLGYRLWTSVQIVLGLLVLAVGCAALGLRWAASKLLRWLFAPGASYPWF